LLTGQRVAVNASGFWQDITDQRPRTCDAVDRSDNVTLSDVSQKKKLDEITDQSLILLERRGLSEWLLVALNPTEWSPGLTWRSGFFLNKERRGMLP
jgi:hypothetical protein